ncbi:MAG: hypothetical protein O3A65_02905 [Proteobacteria bacterium]|nr:hypothetical protein [Pseudomonadota bacterium]
MIFNSTHRKSKLIKILLTGVLMASMSNSSANDRVFIDDLQGIWLEQTYLKALRQTKQPHKAEKKAKPVLIAIKKEGRAYPYFATDMVKARLMIVFDVEPGQEPNTYRLVLGEKNAPTSAEDVVYVWFRGKKSSDGQFLNLEIKEPLVMAAKWASYERVGKELGPIINKIVLSGKYLDGKGKKWTFTDAGKASFPGKTPFYYEISLVGDGATCDYIEFEDLQSPTGLAYYGFNWTQSGTVELFKAKLKGGKVQCQAKPFVALTPM